MNEFWLPKEQKQQQKQTNLSGKSCQPKWPRILDNKVLLFQNITYVLNIA